MVSRTESGALSLSRRTVLGGIAGIAAAAVSTPSFSKAPALLKGAGSFRSLKLVNNRTAERLNTVYWVEGQYIPEALDAFNYILRDWREDMTTVIDPKTIDILAAVHNLLDTSEPFEIVSGYRSAKTNAMLRNRSRGVARNSYHTRGMAVDVTLNSREVPQISAAALSLKAGGVGKYSRSKFVHMDSGPVRDWGR